MYMSDLTNNINEKDYGGKAAGLYKMLEMGVNVPAGFALHKSCREEYLRSNSFPDGLPTELEENIKRLKSDKIIVRSSAIGEDSAGHSFAGQLDSYVVDNSPEQCRKAIVKCWQGLDNERVKAYQKETRFSLKGMGVVVQEYYEADYAGVLFSQSPFAADEIYLEYVQGAGELLVSGQVHPQSITVARNEIEGCGKDLPFDCACLISEALELAERLKYPVDIEWLVCDHKFYFVQVRPITTAAKSKVYWSNTNLNENYPGPIIPLLYSIARDSYYHYFRNLARLLQLDPEETRSLEYEFSNTVGAFANRIYYNMSSIHNILELSPLRDFFRNAFDTFVGYTEKPNKESKMSGLLSKLSFVKNMIKLNIKLKKNVTAIETKVDLFRGHTDKAIELKALARGYYEFLDLRFNQWYSASLADMFAMVYYKLLALMTARICRNNRAAVHNTLLQAIPGLVSSRPLIASWEIIEEIRKDKSKIKYFETDDSFDALSKIMDDPDWAAVKHKFEEYLENWGFRCSGELMLTTKNYSEAPEMLIELLQSYMKNTGQGPLVTIEKKRGEAKQALRKLIKSIFKRRHILLPLSILESLLLLMITRLSKNSIAYRERVRYKQAQMYYDFSRIVRKIGPEFVKSGLLDSPDDIFYLSYKEIGELLSSSYMYTDILKDTLQLRKEHYAYESRKSYSSNITTYFGSNSSPQDGSRAETENCLSGLPVSSGRVKARVKILQSVMEADKLDKGDILVTRQTDPGWAVVFPLISGLIVEIGGALSHGSIVAREFGIPAIAGVPCITETLKDNELIILDGDNGTIQKI